MSTISLDYSKPEWQVVVDRTRAAEHGLTVAAVAAALRGYIGGDVPDPLSRGERALRPAGAGAGTLRSPPAAMSRT